MFGNSKYWKIYAPNNLSIKQARKILKKKHPTTITHKTGTKNRQFLVQFNERKHIRSSKYFGGMPFKQLPFADWVLLTNPKKTINESIKKIITKGCIVKSDVLENPQLIRLLKPLTEANEFFKTDSTFQTIPTHFGHFELNFNQKQKHLYLHGVPNTGKTTFWKLHAGENYTIGPQNNDWRFFDDKKTFVIFDEFTREIAEAVGVHTLNRLMDGECLLNTKGSSKQVKSQHILIFCSNFPPEITIPPHMLPQFNTRIQKIPFEKSGTFDTAALAATNLNSD